MRVGTAVIICKDGCVLLGLRKGPHGRGTWGFPGGALDDEDVKPGECLDQAAVRGALREVSEEIGGDIKISKLIKHPTLPYTVRMFANGQCWTTLYFMAEYVSGEPLLVEPDKFDRWEWFPVDALPDNIFETVAPAYLDAVRAMKNGAQPIYSVVNVPNQEKPGDAPFVVLPERGRQIEEMTFMGGTLVNVRFRPESAVDTPQAGLTPEPGSDVEC